MRKRMLLCLLVMVLILPTGLVLSPPVVAEDQQPSQGAEGIPVLFGPPDVEGFYRGKCSATIVWWDGKKERWSGELWILIMEQSNYAVFALWLAPDLSAMARTRARNIQPPEKAPGLSLLWPSGDYNGWVGTLYVDSVSGRPVNQPPLAAAWFADYEYSQGDFFTSHLTATVKLDKYRNVKSMKGTISQSDRLEWYHATGKFTVKPYFGPLGENGLPPGIELPPGIRLPQRPE